MWDLQIEWDQVSGAGHERETSLLIWISTKCLAHLCHHVRNPTGFLDKLWNRYFIFISMKDFCIVFFLLNRSQSTGWEFIEPVDGLLLLSSKKSKAGLVPNTPYVGDLFPFEWNWLIDEISKQIRFTFAGWFAVSHFFCATSRWRPWANVVSK